MLDEDPNILLLPALSTLRLVAVRQFDQSSGNKVALLEEPSYSTLEDESPLKTCIPVGVFSVEEHCAG